MSEGLDPQTARLLWALTGSLAFVFAAALLIYVVLKRLRRSDEEFRPRISLETETSSALAYASLIQQLRAQEKELERLRHLERERAQATENISAAVLSNLVSGVVLFSANGLVQQANAAAREILGYASPTGLRTAELLRGVKSARVENGGEIDLAAEMNRVFAGGSALRRVQVEYVSPGGAHRVLGVSTSAVRKSTGEVVGVACLLSDLTEVTTLSEQIRMGEQMAALGEMSAGIAHEFKNSLATLSGYAQMLQKETEPATVRDFSARILRETEALARIVTEFLDFARPRQLHRTPVAVLPLLEECAAESGVSLLADMPPQLRVFGDPVSLRQAFANLLRNSAEAALEGTAPEVRVTGRQAGDTVELVLEDNGPGIPPEHLGRIFLPFFTTKPQGTGLGLALVHRIVTQHGGSVSAASGPSGAALTLTFPAAETRDSGEESG